MTGGGALNGLSPSLGIAMVFGSIRPRTLVWASSNEDGNPALVSIDPAYGHRDALHLRPNRPWWRIRRYGLRRRKDVHCGFKPDARFGRDQHVSGRGSGRVPGDARRSHADPARQRDGPRHRHWNHDDPQRDRPRFDESSPTRLVPSSSLSAIPPLRRKRSRGWGSRRSWRIRPG
jgi:hypothetical protein